MKIKKTNVLFLTAIVSGYLLIMSFNVPQKPQEEDKWEVPEKYKKMENPHKGDRSLIRIGKMFYAKYCKSCHGSKGDFDGPEAKQLETSCPVFRSEDFQSQSDGVLYYKSFFGRNEMPNFEKEIPDDDDRWAVINYLRSLQD